MVQQKKKKKGDELSWWRGETSESSCSSLEATEVTLSSLRVQSHTAPQQQATAAEKATQDVAGEKKKKKKRQAGTVRVFFEC